MLEDKMNFRFWPSYWRSVKRLPDAVRLGVFDGICRFAFDGVEPEEPADDATMEELMVDSCLQNLLPHIQSSLESSSAGVKGGRSSGESRKGGSKKSGTPLREDAEPPFENLANPPSQISGTPLRENSEPPFAKNAKQEEEEEVEEEEEEEVEGVVEGGKAAKPPASRKRSVFAPPTEDQVREYCNEQGYSIDPVKFVDYYASVNWVVGRGKPMKDWRAAVRTWVRRDKSSAGRDTDYSRLPGEPQRTLDEIPPHHLDDEGAIVYD